MENHSPTFLAIVEKIADYFQMDIKATLELLQRRQVGSRTTADAATIKQDKTKHKILRWLFHLETVFEKLL